MRMTRIVAAMAPLAVVACAACNNDTCSAAGGHCELGAPRPGCFLGPQTDCNSNPPNPGGGHCCLPCPAGTVPNDGGSGPACVDVGRD